MVMNVPTGGVQPAGIVSEVNYPSKWADSILNHQINGNYNYRIIGPVEVNVESTNILGIVAQGDNGYKKLFEKVKEVGGDNVINVIVDTKYSYYLFGIFQKVSSTIYGIAVKYISTDVKQISYEEQPRPLIYLPLQPQTPIYKPIEKPDKYKNYFLTISGQKYGPVNYQQIQDLKRMGYINDSTPIFEQMTNKEYRVGDFE